MISKRFLDEASPGEARPAVFIKTKSNSTVSKRRNIILVNILYFMIFIVPETLITSDRLILCEKIE